MTILADVATLGSDTGVTVGLVLAVGGMIAVLIRHMVKTEHNQEAQRAAIQEIQKCQQQQQSTNESVNLRITLIERTGTDCHTHPSGRTGRFPSLEERGDR